MNHFNNNKKSFGLFALVLLFGGLLFLAGCEGTTAGECDPGQKFIPDGEQKDGKPTGSCEDCPDNQVPNEDKSACVNCPAGQVPNEDKSACVPCEAGQVPNNEGTQCVAPSNSENMGGGGNNNDNGAVTLATCHAKGQKFENNSCVPCTYGSTRFDATKNECVPLITVSCKCQHTATSPLAGPTNNDPTDVIGKGIDEPSAKQAAKASCERVAGATFVDECTTQ